MGTVVGALVWLMVTYTAPERKIATTSKGRPGVFDSIIPDNGNTVGPRVSGFVSVNADVAWNVYHFTANRRVSSRLAISGLSTSPNFRFLGQVQKFHCSLVDQRKGGFKVRLATRREILWWKICAKLARKSGRFSTTK